MVTFQKIIVKHVHETRGSILNAPRHKNPIKEFFIFLYLFENLEITVFIIRTHIEFLSPGALRIYPRVPGHVYRTPRDKIKDKMK